MQLLPLGIMCFLTLLLLWATIDGEGQDTAGSTDG